MCSIDKVESTISSIISHYITRSCKYVDILYWAVYWFCFQIEITKIIKKTMQKIRQYIGLGLLGASCFSVIAFYRGEPKFYSNVSCNQEITILLGLISCFKMCELIFWCNSKEWLSKYFSFPKQSFFKIIKVWIRPIRGQYS